MNKFLTVIFLVVFAESLFSQVKYASEPTWYKTYDIKFYSINLDINDTSTFLQGYTSVKLLTKEQTDSLIFEFNPKLTIDSVLLGSQKLKFSFRSDLLILKGFGIKPAGNLMDVTIYYKGDAGTSTFFSSVSNEKNTYWNTPVTWTLSEPFGAKNWFPCKQQLTDKADSCWVFLTVPRSRKAGSVGLLTDTVNVGNNKTQFRWKSSYPVAYYLISFTVAKYRDYSFYARINGNKDSVLVQNYIYNQPGYLESNKADIDRTGDFLRLFSQLFGEYPFKKEKYGHCVAPMGGGMEHQTMTTLVNFGYSLVAHELAHQWFGNKTTCATWQDIWINEGFASYAEYLAYEHLGTKAEAASWMANAQNRALREPEGAVFLNVAEAADENRIFSTNLSYKKGAVILHLLRHQINNDSLFFKTLRSYLEKYRYTSATGDDFKNIAEQVTGLELDKFFEQWYYGRGFPKFDISWKVSGDSLLVNIKQTPSSKSVQLFNTFFEVKALGANYDTVFRFEQNQTPQLFKVKITKPVTNVLFDPDAWLLKSVQSLTQLPEIPSEDNYFDVNPSPFSSYLNIRFNQEPMQNEKISLINIKGGVVLETTSRKKKEITLNTSTLVPGIYLLIVGHGNEKYVRKLTKSNNF